MTKQEKQTTFEKTVEFCGKRLEEEKACSFNSYARKLNMELGSLIYDLTMIQSKIIQKEKQINENVFQWWYEYNLAKRTMKKFGVRDVYKSPKALEYWRKWYPRYNREFKGKKPIISNEFDDANKNILIGLLQKMTLSDIKNSEHYLYVINKLEG